LDAFEEKLTVVENAALRRERLAAAKEDELVMLALTRSPTMSEASVEGG